MSSTMTLLAKVVLILMILTATKAEDTQTCQKKSAIFATTCSKNKGNGNLEPLPLVFAEMKYTMGGYVARRLIDNDLNNFAHTVDSTDGVWIRVKLAQVDTIKQINIYNRRDCCQDRIVGLSVYIKRDDTVVTECGKINHATSSYTFNCVGLGNVVELRADGRISQQNIAEIKVLGSTSGYQKLSFESAEMKNTLGGYRAERLIDNNYNNFAHTMTSSDGIWIRAKLAQTKHIKLIRISNRKDCCQDRIVGISVYIKQDDTVVTKCGTISAAHRGYIFHCRGRGNTVELSAEGTISQQNIAEIEAFGTPAGYEPTLLMDCEVAADKTGTDCANQEQYLHSKCSMESCPGGCTSKWVGCFKDSKTRAIDGGMRLRSNNPIVDCQNYAGANGWTVFAVQYSTQCFSAANAGLTYSKYGKSNNCEKGRGGYWAQDVYEVTCEQ